MPQRMIATDRRRRTQREDITHAIEAVSEALSVLPVDLRNVLQTIAEQARRVAGAEYAALGIVMDGTSPFEPWVYSGVPLKQAAAIGHYPRPVGLLGAVPQEGKTIRLRDLHQDPRFHGFPRHHPEMVPFLGVPIRYRGESVGNLYLANKVGAEEFSDEDQWAVELLAAHAGVALQVAGIDKLRAEVDAERARLQIILENAPHGILYVESRTERLLANPAARELLGRSPDPEAGLAQFVGHILHPDGRPATREELTASRALRGEIARAEEYLVQRPDGSRVPVLASATPVRGPEGEITGAVTVFEDITPIKELERVREEWGSLITHDLRQPVTVITGYVGLLRRLLSQHTPAEGEARAIEHIGAAIGNLGRMIGELMDISRLEAQRMSLERRTVDLPALVRTVVERMAETTSGHPVRVDVRGEIPPVWADPGRIEQILGNLLSNAAKYGDPETEITLGVDLLDGQVRVSVTNQGQGIAPEELSKLFTRFHRTRLAQQESVPGLGLGLYISKGLVEAHGGRISAESVPGKTTAFHFTLPLA